MSEWEDNFLKGAYGVWPQPELPEKSPSTTELYLKIKEAESLLYDIGASGIFELIQVEIKLKEALGWMKQMK